MAFIEVAGSCDELLSWRCENVLFWVWVDARGSIFRLFDAIEVEENGFKIVFILEEEWIFNSLA